MMHRHAHEPAGSAFHDRLPAEFGSTQENLESNAKLLKAFLLAASNPSPILRQGFWLVSNTCAAVAVPLAFLGEHGRTILRAGDGGKGLSSASAPDSPTTATTFCRSLLHLRYIRSSISTNWVLVVSSERWLKQFVVNRHNGSL